LLSDLPRSGSYVFPATRLNDAPYGSLPKAWGRIISKAKTEAENPLGGLTPHGLRHAFASVGGDLGLSEITIAALIGHSSASVTGRYIHALDSALIATADRVARSIDSQMTGQDEGGVVVPLRQA
jgi:integrase